MRRLLPTLLAVALSLGLALERLWQVANAPGATLVGDWTHPDCLGNHWLLVWVAERLASGQSLVHNDAYYAPFGDAPWLAGNGSEGLLYLPFHLALGWPTGAGLFLVVMLTMNGLGGYLLGRAAGAGPWASLVAAAATGSSVYVVQELGAGRFTQGDIGWTCAALAGLLMLLERPTRLRVIGGGVALAVAAGLYWYHGVFLALAAGLLVLGRLVTRRAVPWRALLSAGALSLVLVAPLLAVFLGHWQGIPGTEEAVFPHPEATIDALRLRWPFGVREGRHVVQALSIPVAALALLPLARWVLRRSPRPGQTLGLLLVGAVFLWLAMGPQAGLYTWVYGLAAPLRRFWWPHRHLLMAHLALAALAALGAQLLVGWLKDRGHAALGAAVAVLLALSVSPALRWMGEPVRVHQSPVELPPDLYDELAEQPGELLLQLPFTPQVATTQTPLIYQIFHRKRMINGHSPWVDRVRPAEWDAMVSTNSFLAALAAYERGEMPADGQLRFEAPHLQALIDQGLGVMVVDQEHFPLPLRDLYKGLNAALEQLFGRPVLRRKRAAVYSTEGWTGATEAELLIWQWPPALRRPQPGQPLVGRRARSPTFDPR